MTARPDRPFSATSRLESAVPLHGASPVSRLLARSQSQSTADAKRYQSSITRTQALDDSAKTHSSPSKTRSVRHAEGRPQPTPQSVSKAPCASLIRLCHALASLAAAWMPPCQDGHMLCLKHHLGLILLLAYTQQQQGCT